MKLDPRFFLILFIFSFGCGPRPSYLVNSPIVIPVIPEAPLPLPIEAGDTINFNQLPLEGEVDSGKKFWSGDYWALNKGNINLRWNSSRPVGFNYISPSREEVSSWTLDELALLSPAEKYDLFTGNYHYPLKKNVYTHASRDAANWEGICDGWAGASMNHNEPQPKVLTNPEGLRIPFGSSDIKALLSYYYAYEHQVSTFQEGRRCPRRRGIFNRNPDCKEDLSAGVFHIFLANKIGKEKKGLIADIKPYKEVWNHPIISYQSEMIRTEPPRRNALKEARSSVQIKTIIRYVDESEINTWHPINGTNYQVISQLQYQYVLDLDGTGNIIGGTWKSFGRPDFIWTKAPPKLFIGILSRLGELLDD